MSVQRYKIDLVRVTGGRVAVGKLNGTDKDFVLSAKYDHVINEAGTLTIQIGSDHSYYSTIKRCENFGVRRFLLRLERYDYSSLAYEIMWEGIFDEVSIDSFGRMTITAIGTLAFLKDAFFDYSMLSEVDEDGNETEIKPTLTQLWKQMIKDHNGHMLYSTSSDLYCPLISEEGSSVADNYATKNAISILEGNTASTYDQLQKICSDYPLYIRVGYSKDDTTRANEYKQNIDLVTIGSYAHSSAQRLYSKDHTDQRANIISSSDKTFGGDVFTVLYPVGKNGLLCTEAAESEGKAWIVDSTHAAQYGYIWKRIEWNDIEDADTLYAAGLAYINWHNSDIGQYTVKAVDLVDAGLATSCLDLGSKVTYDDSATTYITELHLDLMHPDQNSYTLGFKSEFKLTATSLVNSITEKSITKINSDIVEIQDRINTPASSTTLGGIKIQEDSGLSIDEEGNVSVTGGGGGGYELPVATSSVLGGVKIPSYYTARSGLLITGQGYLSVAGATDKYLGGIIVGDGLSCSSSGVLSVNTATSSSTGTVKAGTGIAIDSNGAITANELYNGTTNYVELNSNNVTIRSGTIATKASALIYAGQSSDGNAYIQLAAGADNTAELEVSSDCTVISSGKIYIESTPYIAWDDTTHKYTAVTDSKISDNDGEIYGITTNLWIIAAEVAVNGKTVQAKETLTFKVGSVTIQPRANVPFSVYGFGSTVLQFSAYLSADDKCVYVTLANPTTAAITYVGRINITTMFLI